MRRVIASLGDDAPSASAKRAECAKGDRLVVHVDVLGLEDSTVVLGLPCAVPYWRANSSMNFISVPELPDFSVTPGNISRTIPPG